MKKPLAIILFLVLAVFCADFLFAQEKRIPLIQEKKIPLIAGGKYFSIYGGVVVTFRNTEPSAVT